MTKTRIYKYDNVKALLIFLVVLGHMTSDYVSDSHMIRWTTLWIYSFHMPAFIFLSGLVHKHYITEERASLGIKGETRLRWDKVLGFFLCGYGLKIFLQFTRSLMGQNPIWHWTEEPGIPWYLFVMAEYELLFYVMRRLDGRVKPPVMIAGAFALSAAIGYFPVVGDNFCLSRMINFLPIYMLGYYLDMKKLLPLLEGEGYRDPNQAGSVLMQCGIGPAQSGNGLPQSGIGPAQSGAGLVQATADTAAASAESSVRLRAANDMSGKTRRSGAPLQTGEDAAGKTRRSGARVMKIMAWVGIAASMAVCAFGKWGLYSWRKWFTGRRSYEYLQQFFDYAVKDGWWIRLAVWAVALAITFCILVVIPDRDMGFITTIGSRTLNVYFWHRPLCYLFRNWAVLPKLCVFFGGTYNASVAGMKHGLAFGGSVWSMLAAYIIYILIAAAMTALFSLEIFGHPCNDLMNLAAKITGKSEDSRQN